MFAAGYVFGRSGWGTRASFGKMSFYSLRFGPGSQIHGHADHMGLTYFARGRDLQGWVSRGQNQRAAAPVVTMTRYGSSASILTLIVPAAPGTAVSASAGAQGAGRYLLRIAIGAAARTLLVSANGTIRA